MADTSSIGELIKRAQAGDKGALNQLLVTCRPFVKIHAQRQMSAALRRQVDPSDVVQITLLDIYRGFHRFRGNSELQFEAWLKPMLRRNILDSCDLIQSGIFPKALFDDPVSAILGCSEAMANDCSASSKAMRGEAAICLARAMERLTEPQREAVRLRHIEGWPLARIAERLGRSEQATAGLVKRGIKTLRKILGKEP